MSNEQNDKDPLVKLGTWLAGGQAIIIGALSALGVATGAIQRILRNNPEQAALWLAYIGFGVLSGVLVANTSTQSVRLDTRYLAGAFGGGAILAFGSLWNFFGYERLELAPGWRIGLGILFGMGALAVLVAFFTVRKPGSGNRPDPTVYDWLHRSWSGLLALITFSLVTFTVWQVPTTRVLVMLLGASIIIWVIAVAPKKANQSLEHDTEDNRSITTLFLYHDRQPPPGEGS